ncbi:MAG: DUF599 family protein [Candidatus Heimdallarchaeota archaeon]
MLDELAFFSFIGCLIIAIIFLFVSLKKPYTRKGLRRKIMSNWVEINLKEGNKTTAVQALRNLLMVNAAFISALLVLSGLIIGLYNRVFTNSDVFLWIPRFKVGLAQMILIVITIVISLFSFINSNRMIGNLTFLITSNPEEVEIEDFKGINLVKDTFRIAQRSWMFGIRGLFYLIVSLTWLIHPLVFLICSYLVTVYIILVQDLAVFDRKLKD